MRYWTVASKYLVYRDGEVSHTEVTISASNEGYANITVQVAGDQLGKSDAELIELAREAFFKTEFSDKAMPEAIQKVDEMDAIVCEVNKKLVEVDAALGKLNQALAEAKGNTDNMLQLITGTLNEALEMLFEDEEVADEEATEEVL